MALNYTVVSLFVPIVIHVDFLRVIQMLIFPAEQKHAIYRRSVRATRTDYFQRK